MRKLGIGLLVWLMVELWLLVLLAQLIGGWGVLAVTIGSVLTGRFLLKGQWSAIQQAMRSARAQPLVHSPGAGGARILAGILFIMPGLLSDFIALLCLLPQTRAWFLRRLIGRMGGVGQYSARQAHRVFEGEILPDEPPAALSRHSSNKL